VPITNPDILSDISSRDVIAAINDLRNNSCPGPDGLPNWFVKNISCFLAQPLSCLFNVFVRTGFFVMKCDFIVCMSCRLLRNVELFGILGLSHDICPGLSLLF
jgi:hypothetical protein